MNMITTALSVRDIDLLLAPFRHRKLILRSRLVMTSPAGVEAVWPHLGLMITPPVAVCEEGAEQGMPEMYGGAAFRQWKQVCRRVHGQGCRLVPLLSYVAPEMNAAALHRGALQAVAGAFGAAAYAARRLGFDGVAVDGGGAGIIGAFLRGAGRHRSDEYGGVSRGRMRLACEVVHAVRKAVGRRFPVLFRLEQPVQSPQELEFLLQPLCAAGVDMIICRGETGHAPAFAGSGLSLSGWVRLLSNRPVITESGAGTAGVSLARLAQQLRAGEFDLLALGKTMQTDDNWPPMTQ